MASTQGSRRNEQRFGEVFAHFVLVCAFARRRGSRDPEAVASEAMSIAWDKLDQIQSGRERAWLLATARNLVRAEIRSSGRNEATDPASIEIVSEDVELGLECLDPEIESALATLTPGEREALLLIAWDELSPSEAAASLGMNPVAFRVRLHRARSRFAKSLGTKASAPSPKPSPVKGSS